MFHKLAKVATNARKFPGECSTDQQNRQFLYNVVKKKSKSRQKLTKTLQARKEKIGISAKTDKNFTAVYRKCRNLAEKRLKLYMSVKEITLARLEVGFGGFGGFGGVEELKS